MSLGVWATADCVAAAAGAVAAVWDPSQPAGSEVKIFEGTPIYSLDFSRNNKVLAVASDKGQLVLHSAKPHGPGGDRAVGRMPALPEPGLDAITFVRFTHNDAHLIGGTRHGAVRIWSLRAKDDERTLSGLSGAVTCVAISPNGALLASSSESGQVLLHDFATGARRRSLARGGGPALNHLVLSPAAPSLLAAGSASGSLLLWNLEGGEQLDSLRAHKGAVTGLTVPDASPELLLSCGSDGVLQCTDRRTGQQAWSVSLGMPLSALSLKHDGALLAVGSAGGALRLHDMRSVSNPLAALAFSDASTPVVAVRWQHDYASRSARPPAAPGAAAPAFATAPAPAAVAAAVPATSAATVGTTTSGWTAAQPPRGVTAAAASDGFGARRTPKSAPGTPGLSGVSVSASVELCMRPLSPGAGCGSPSDSGAAVSSGGLWPPQLHNRPGLAALSPGHMPAAPGTDNSSSSSVLGLPACAVPPTGRGHAASSASVPPDTLPAVPQGGGGGSDSPDSLVGLQAAGGAPRSPWPAAPQQQPAADQAALSGQGGGGTTARPPPAAAAAGGTPGRPSRTAIASSRAVAVAAPAALTRAAPNKGSAGTGTPGTAGARRTMARVSETSDANGEGQGLPSSSWSARPGSEGMAGMTTAGAAALREDVFKGYVDAAVAGLRDEVKALHLDMLRQFHQAQMDLVSVADGLAQRQEQLAEAVSTLAGALSNMQTAKAHNVGGLRSGELPWM